MDRLKVFLKYALWVIGFMILSEFLINVGLNSRYKDINRLDKIKQVEVYQAEATAINGRIRGIIRNSQSEDISGKYVEVNLYSKRDVFLGKQYVEVKKLEDEEIQAFELLFKLNNVHHYEINIVDKKDPEGQIELLHKNLTKGEIIVGTIFAMLVL